jgi:sugar phosphate isomerase/epimerase
VTLFTLGINNCFAVKRWPEPERWAAIIRERLGLNLVQHCLDLADMSGSREQRKQDAARVSEACLDFGLSMHSTFTGLGVYTSNMLLDPHPSRRASAEAWYRRAIEYSSAAGAQGIGGHVGAYSATDWEDPRRKREMLTKLRSALRRLTAFAHRSGLKVVFVENLPLAREPSTMDALKRFASPADDAHVPVELCLDVGHMCVPGATGPESDPYAWLRELGRLAPLVHLQQSEADSDRHWPFTRETNRVGRVEAMRVLDSLDESGATAVALVLEVVPPFLKSDAQVLDELAESVSYWQDALAAHGAIERANSGGEPSGVRRPA